MIRKLVCALALTLSVIAPVNTAPPGDPPICNVPPLCS